MKISFVSAQPSSGIVWLVEIGQVKLGISTDSDWKIALRGEVRLLSDPKDIAMLLPLLEVGRQKFYEQLAEVSKCQPDLHVLTSFPETMLLKCALELSVSDYWPLKGLEWLESTPQLIDSFKETLSELQKRSWATQPLKHKIRFVLKRGKTQRLPHPD
jgi:hypothetical protein